MEWSPHWTKSLLAPSSQVAPSLNFGSASRQAQIHRLSSPNSFHKGAHCLTALPTLHHLLPLPKARCFVVCLRPFFSSSVTDAASTRRTLCLLTHLHVSALCLFYLAHISSSSSPFSFRAQLQIAGHHRDQAQRDLSIKDPTPDTRLTSLATSKGVAHLRAISHSLTTSLSSTHYPITAPAPAPSQKSSGLRALSHLSRVTTRLPTATTTLNFNHSHMHGIDSLIQPARNDGWRTVEVVKGVYISSLPPLLLPSTGSR